MKKSIGLLLVLIPLFLSAQPTEKSLLWKISGNGLTKSSYLFGTIHLIPKRDFFLSKAVEQAFGSTEQVVFEIDMKEIEDQTAQIGLIMKAMMRGDSTLQDLVSAVDYEVIKEEFEKRGMPLSMFERLKPLFLSTMLLGDGKPTPGDSENLLDDFKSYEVELMRLAQEQNKDIKGLESIDYQMSIFDSIPYRTQAAMLVAGIKKDDKGNKEEFQQMLELYKKQDIEAMQALFSADKEGTAVFEKLLLTDRNRRWISEMQKLMAQKVTFFAVGAGHLGGEKGIIVLLRKAGFTLSSFQ